MDRKVQSLLVTKMSRTLSDLIGQLPIVYLLKGEC